MDQVSRLQERKDEGEVWTGNREERDDQGCRGVWEHSTVLGVFTLRLAEDFSQNVKAPSSHLVWVSCKWTPSEVRWDVKAFRSTIKRWMMASTECVTSRLSFNFMQHWGWSIKRGVSVEIIHTPLVFDDGLRFHENTDGIEGKKGSMVSWLLTSFIESISIFFMYLLLYKPSSRGQESISRWC